MKNKKIIKISGYFARNLGDDLMIEILLRRYPGFIFWNPRSGSKKSFAMEGSNYIAIDDIYYKYGRLNHILNILTLNRNKDFLIRYISKKISENCVCGIGIGGSLYAEWDSDLSKRMWYENSKKVENKPFFIIGANFGPYKTIEFFEAFRNYFKECRSVVFRDMASKKLFCDVPQVKYAPDVVFNLAGGYW